jgi:hypothetical protein
MHSVHRWRHYACPASHEVHLHGYQWRHQQDHHHVDRDNVSGPHFVLHFGCAMLTKQGSTYGGRTGLCRCYLYKRWDWQLVGRTRWC